MSPSTSEHHMSVDTYNPLSPPASRSDYSLNRSGSSYNRGRRGSTASSIHSIGGSLDTLSGGWPHPMTESGQNAISTLLQPPIVRTGLVPHSIAPASSAHKPPTSRDIPPVALTNIAQIDPAEFKPYLLQVGALYEQLRRAKDSDDDGAGIRRISKRDDLPEPGEEGHLRPGTRPTHPNRRPSITSLSSISSMDASSIRKSSSSSSRRTAQGPPPLTTIPNVYFDADFHLENPRTFDVVSERSEVVRPAPGSVDDKSTNGNTSAPRKALATNAILQEKLSWYMDTIEMHLINSISTASTTFFTALGSLRELHSEAADSVDRIRVLRTELEALDTEVAQSGLDMAQKQRRQENMQQLNDAVLQLRNIVEGVGLCESLVDAGEVEEALGRIEALESLIAGEVQEDGQVTSELQTIRLRDLTGTIALQGVNEDLNTLRLRIGKAYETKLVSVLLGDLRRHFETVKQQEVLMRWSSASMRAKVGHSREPSVFPSYMASIEELKSAIRANLTGLHRAKHVATATSAYREAVLREIRNLIRRPLPSSNDDDNESMMSASTMGSGRHMSNKEKSSVLARNLRALDPKDAEDLLKSVYIGVTETLRRLTTQVKVLLDVASCLSDPSGASGMKSPQIRSPLASPQLDRHPPHDSSAFEIQEEIHKAIDVSNLLGQAVDISHDKIVRVLKVRAEQSSHLPLVWFLRYFTLNLHFANECESISGRSGASLKTLVNGHIREFVQHHGDTEKQKLAQGMESDQWSAKDFTERDNALLSQIVESSTRDAPSWSDGSKIWIEHTEEDENKSAASPEPNGTGKDKTRTATVDGESFLVPHSAILCLEGVSHFMRLMKGIPSMTTDVATSLIAYLHLFNSRCTQLILGAGATRSAGLKHITTRHLALASQALALIVTLIPHVREFVRRYAGSSAGVSGTMGEFDKVRRLFQEHQNSIYDKLVDIMSGRAAQHSKSIKAVDWDDEDINAVHPFMEALVKEVATLHRVLTKHLPEASVQMIMGPVFASYKDQLGRTFQAATPKTEHGLRSMRRDVDFFISKLGKVQGYGGMGEHLISLIEAKTVETPVDTQGNGSEEKEESKATKGDEGAGSQTRDASPTMQTSPVNDTTQKENGK